MECRHLSEVVEGLLLLEEMVVRVEEQEPHREMELLFREVQLFRLVREISEELDSMLEVVMKLEEVEEELAPLEEIVLGQQLEQEEMEHLLQYLVLQ